MAEYTESKLHSQRAGPEIIVMENDFTRLEIDTSTGSLASVYNKAERISVPITLSVLYYRAFQSGRPNSGAYVFRPNSDKTYPAAGINGGDGAGAGRAGGMGGISLKDLGIQGISDSPVPLFGTSMSALTDEA